MSEREQFKIHLGDCLEVMRGLPDSSVDAIVTDPPYGLAFMGKRWDYDVPSVDIWEQCLRVLKPGGHLLAFAGTRTQHRMAVRIEDAGFEIRDMIAWVYSTGFPKSHNFGCKCSRDALPYSHEEKLPREPKAERDLHPLRQSNVSPSLDIGERRGEVLQPCMSQSGVSIEGREQLWTSKVWSAESSMEGGSDILEEARKLQADQVCPVSKRVPTDGEEGRIHYGTPFDNGRDVRALPIEDRSRASCEPQPAGQPTGESGVIPKQRGAQEGGVETDQVCAKCGKLADWSGWGTALKPALEPITVARKPLIGTVAENVLAHGTGALNIDGCRTNPGGAVPGGGGLKGGASSRHEGWKRAAHLTNEATQPHTAGRWPANLIHDGGDECVDLLKDAARFFYCSKASKLDRGSGNNHPTVKPTDLMRYLCCLVTPPGGLVLDPFAGSGSTGRGAILEGFRFIGIERDPEYVKIAEARIAASVTEREANRGLFD